METGKADSPRSLKDFDFFGDGTGKTAQGGMEEQLALYRKRRKGHSRFVFLATLTFILSLTFLWDYEADISYAFSPARAPIALGDVTELGLGELVPNTYVSLQGITEHRGITQSRVRGLGVDKQSWWYFRLVGSNGVFIEVEPNEEVYGITTHVSVSGRVVDLESSSAFKGLLHHYRQRFEPQRGRRLRLIEVGRQPGEGKTPYLIAFSFLMLLLISNGAALVRLLRLRSQRPLIQASPKGS